MCAIRIAPPNVLNAQPTRAPPKIPTLKELDQAFRNIQDKESYDAIFQDFVRYYQVLPKGTKEGDWLEFVGKLAESEFLDLDSSIKFGQDLEDVNPKLQKAIANTIGLALKYKKKD
ncbi:hypothetical protein NHP200010_10020 [Helicobacter bizzozeronii]|uniref:hypothetical protein n=2 Tax=Helicobacter bizzozeronii TaxID=56877 RepID=UPI00244D7DFC|nr:hypothetical protein [Helicobacter bizzozeronii]GMB93288.1 hypothetical protein NHP200010_10020 [Helicobacter bizzozeronii]